MFWCGRASGGRGCCCGEMQHLWAGLLSCWQFSARLQSQKDWVWFHCAIVRESPLSKGEIAALRHRCGCDMRKDGNLRPWVVVA